MRVDGRLGSDGTDEVDLLGRVRDVILASNDVCDAVPDVLHRRCKVVGRTPVGPNEHEILELIVRKLDAPAHGVLPGRNTFVRHPKTNGAFVLVGLSLLDEPARDFRAIGEAIELERHLAVPVQSEPAQRVLDLLGRLRDFAARVGVLDSEPELAALVPREEPVEERGPHVADVEEPRRARGHADANGHAVRLLACCSAPIAQEGSRRRSPRAPTWAPRPCSSSSRARAPGASRTMIQRISRPFARNVRRQASRRSCMPSTSSTSLRPTTTSTARAWRRCGRRSTRPAPSTLTASFSMSAPTSVLASRPGWNGSCRRSSRFLTAPTTAPGC